MIERNTFRKRHKYFGAVLSEALRPLLLQHARRRSPPPSHPDSWRRGLLLGANHIGDVLYNTSSLPALQRRWPQCQWNWLTAEPAAQALRGNPSIASLLTRAEAEECAGRQPFDAVICYNTGQYLPDLRFALKLGIPNRIGYVHKGFSAWVTHPIRIAYPQPFPAYFRDLVSQLTGQEGTWPLRPQVFPEPAALLAAEEAWGRLARSPLKTLACFVTSRQPSGVWPPQKFGETLRLLLQEFPCRIVLCGAPSDEEILQQVRQTHAPSAEILAGKLSLGALVAFLRKCHAVLSTDSGPRHLANAAGSPLVFIRNLYHHGVEAGVYCDTEFDMAPPGGMLDSTEQARVFERLAPATVSAQLASILRSSAAEPV